MADSLEATDPAASIRLASDRDIVIERTFDAPREAVFEAWTDPNRLARWWDPTGVPLAEASIDLRPGGRFRFVHKAEAARGHAFVGTYREVVYPSLLIFTTPGPGGGETVGTLRFEDMGGRTQLVMTMSSASSDAREQLLKYGIDTGTARTLENLSAFLTRAEAASR